jgi:hypothetical protein
MCINYMHRLLKIICKMKFKTNYVNKLFFIKLCIQVVSKSYIKNVGTKFEYNKNYECTKL